MAIIGLNQDDNSYEPPSGKAPSWYSDPYSNGTSAPISTTPGRPIETASPTPDPGPAPASTFDWNAGGTATPNDAVSMFYKQMLGRDPEAGAVNAWLAGTGNNYAAIQQGIFNSPEAAAYRAQTPTPPAGGSPTTSGGTQWILDALNAVQSTDDPNYWIGKWNSGELGTDKNWVIDAIRRGDGSALVKSGQLTTRGGGSGGSPQSNYAGTNVFSDPATQQYEQLLNAMIQRLQTPYQAPDLNPALDYLRNYFQQLQGPAYTDQQLGTMQTQALDPLERQRTVAKQQVMQRLSARGISQSSGIFEKALQDVDRQFDQLRTQTQGKFATNAIGQQNQNFAQAASLGPLIASLEQQQFQGNENRAMQGVQQASIIPNLAWSRLTGAQQGVQQINPFSAFQLQNSFQNAGYQQSNDFTSQLLQILQTLFT